MTTSPPRLRVVGTPGDPRPGRRKEDRAGALDPEPRPFLYRMTEHRHRDGSPYTDTLYVWSNEEGLRCRRCEPGTCTFAPGHEGVGSCITRRDGGLVGPIPLPLAFSAGD